MRIKIEEFAHFEIVISRALRENTKSDKAEKQTKELLLKIFKAGFELGKNGQAEIEI